MVSLKLLEAGTETVEKKPWKLFAEPQIVQSYMNTRVFKSILTNLDSISL
jgi:hypothetical protein